MKKIILLFFIIGFLVYFQSLFNGFVWDDSGGQIVGNYNLIGYDKLFKIFIYNWSLYYKPLFYIALSFLLTTFGENPFPFHLFSLALHVSNSILIYYLFSRFFKREISVILGLIFLVHPAISEAVLYASAIQDVLYPFFGLIALNIVVWQKKFRYVNFAVFSLLTLSLLSKETGFVFLPAVIVYKYFFERSDIKKYLLSSIFLTLIYLFIRIGVVGINPFNSLDTYSQWTYDADSKTRLLTMPKIIAKYLFLAIWPEKLQIFQLWWVRKIDFNSFYFPSAVLANFFIAIFSYGAIQYLKSKKQIYPYFIFLSLLVIGLLLHAQILVLDMTFAERWFYVPLIGLLGLLGYVLNKVELSKNRKRTFYALGVIIIVLLSLRTFIRTFDWHTDRTISKHDLEVDKDNIGPYFVLGDYYTTRQELSKVDKLYSDLEKRVPENENVDVARWFLAFSRNDYKKAEEILRKSPKQLTKTKIDYTYTLLRIDPIKAEKYAKGVLAEHPESSEFNYLVALTRYAQGDRYDAIKYMSIAARYGWRHAEMKAILEKMVKGEKIKLDYTQLEHL